MTPPIALEHVSVRLGVAEVLSDLSLEVGEGEVLSVIGPSGSGKTTLLRLILGFVAVHRGVVRLRGEPVSASGRILRAPEERNLAVIFQDLALWPHLTVHGNLTFGLEAKHVERKQRETRIAAMLERVGLAAKGSAYPRELSGGEQQWVAIARALVLEPHAVLFDEPLANLDIMLRHEMLQTFRALLSERRATALYVTHEPREAAGLGDRIAVLETGRLTQVGTLEDLRARPASAFARGVVAELAVSGA
jgi:iron(III) transport system ATP-binding protein